jgi:hypothetical protein
MANIFENTPQTIGGAFTAENCVMTGDGMGDGAVVQRVQLSIERPINFIYEIGSGNGRQNVYYIGGRRRGQATFERIVGGSNTFGNFVNNYGPLCNSTSTPITLEARGRCNIGPGAAGVLAPAPGVKYKLLTPKLTTVGASVSAQDIVIMESVTLVFLDLDYEVT